MSDSIQRSAAVLYQMEEETPGLKESAQALVSDTMLWPALNGTGATREEKEELIRTAPMLAGKEQLTAFVLLLLEQGTLDSLPAILRELRQLELAAQGGAVCVVTCARQPDEATLEDLRRAVCRLRGLERVVLQIKIDPAILGGFRLEVQGVVYDRSVRGRLERLAQGLKGDFDADSEELEGLVETALCEAQIESLVIAKGYTDCVAYMNDGGISVAVAAPEEGLQETDVALISDIVMTQADLDLADIRIVEVK